MTVPVLLAADDITAAINAGTWTIGAISAARVYRIETTLKDFPVSGSSPLVEVGIATEEASPFSRHERRYDIAVDVAIRQIVNPDVNAQGDALLELAEEFSTFFIGPPPWSSSHGATALSAEKLGLYLPTDLDQYRVLTAVLRVNLITLK